MRPTPMIGPLLALALAACGEPSGPIAPLEEIGCGDRAAAGSVVEMASTLGSVASVRLGACGDLSFVDPAGDLFVADAALVEARRIATGLSAVTFSRLGDQLLARRAGGAVVWMRVGAEDRAVELELEASGFVRRGEVELAWGCVDGALGTIAEDGLTAVRSDARCDRVWAAPEVPVVAYVDEELALRVVDLASAQTWDLSEVPFIAASSDQVRLSRDGRILFHQPGTSPSSRIGIFDLHLPEGARLLAAPEVATSLGGIVEAARGAHTAAIRTTDGVLIVTPGGYLNAYEGATLFGLDPSGERALLAFPPAWDAGGRWGLSISNLDAATLETLGTVGARLSLQITSQDGDTVASWGQSPDGTRSVTTLYRWSSGVLSERTDMGSWRRPAWIGMSGATVMSEYEALVMRSATDTVLHRWPGAWGAAVWEVRGGEQALLRVYGSVDRLLLVSTSGSEERVLFEGAGLDSVVVDADAERFAYVTVAPDEDDPTQPRSRVFAGAIP